MPEEGTADWNHSLSAIEKALSPEEALMSKCHHKHFGALSANVRLPQRLCRAASAPICVLINALKESAVHTLWNWDEIPARGPCALFHVRAVTEERRRSIVVWSFKIKPSAAGQRHPATPTASRPALRWRPRPALRWRPRPALRWRPRPALRWRPRPALRWRRRPEAVLRCLPVSAVRHGGDAAGAQSDAAAEPVRGAGGGAAGSRGVAAGEASLPQNCSMNTHVK
ncbi:vesicle transport protein USE1 isoform X1 [Gallus gallus]|uniref:vesicle transport protein USE1 isoform X1 n=1 Tax=Gallus gallus TaxID=9031 RepID=UPI001F031588|nr:vesicle transport protein USE1 isoform X1 [Gallus gallus]